MSNVIRIATAAPAQTFNVMLTGKQLILTIAGMRCTLALYKQLPQASLLGENGKLNGIAHGIINHHLRECELAEPDTHIHIVWTTNNKIYRDTIWVTNITINTNYKHVVSPSYSSFRYEAQKEYIQPLQSNSDFYNWVYKNNHTKGRKFNKLSQRQQIPIIEQYKGDKFEDWYKANYSEKYANDQRNQKAYQKAHQTYNQKWTDTIQALRDGLPQLLIGS